MVITVANIIPVVIMGEIKPNKRPEYMVNKRKSNIFNWRTIFGFEHWYKNREFSCYFTPLKLVKEFLDCEDFCSNRSLRSFSTKVLWKMGLLERW